MKLQAFRKSADQADLPIVKTLRVFSQWFLLKSAYLIQRIKLETNEV